MPLAGTGCGYPTSSTSASGARRCASVSSASSRAPIWGGSAVRSDSSEVPCRSHGSPVGSEVAAVVQPNITPRYHEKSLPPRLTVTKSVPLVTASSWGGQASPPRDCGWVPFSVVAPPQLTSTSFAPIAFATRLG